MKKIIISLVIFLPFFASCKIQEAEAPKIDFSAASPWKIEVRHGKGTVNWNPQTGIGDCEYLKIESEDESDVLFYQTLNLKPGHVYRISAEYKTTDVTGTHGAAIWLKDTWINSAIKNGTTDWQKYSLVFLTPENGRADIAFRLWASSGAAHFRNPEIELLDFHSVSSEYLTFRVDKKHLADIRPETVADWLANMDRVYEKYVELIGKKPYDGKRITILGVEQYPWGWAVAGNPIIWYDRFIPSELANIQEKGDWSFGIMHEIAHNFNASDGYAIKGCNENWNWNEEMFANFRMYYAVETLNGAFLQRNKLYRGDEAKYFYKTDVGDSYDKLFPEGKFGHDALMYTFIRIKDEIGWEPFKKTFARAYDHKTEFVCDWDKFNYFLDLLSEYASFDVRATYLDGELETVRRHLQK